MKISFYLIGSQKKAEADRSITGVWSNYQVKFSHRSVSRKFRDNFFAPDQTRSAQHLVGFKVKEEKASREV